MEAKSITISGPVSSKRKQWQHFLTGYKNYKTIADNKEGKLAHPFQKPPTQKNQNKQKKPTKTTNKQTKNKPLRNQRDAANS